MDTRTRAPRANRSEFQMIVEFIGIRTIVIFGFIGALYFVSAYHNFFNDNRPLLESFNPYYAFRLHDGTRIMGNFWDSVWDWIGGMFQSVLDFFNAQWQRVVSYMDSNIRPFLDENPNLAIALFLGLGFIVFVIMFLTVLYGFKIVYSFFPKSAAYSQGSVDAVLDDLWVYDPSKKTSEEQLKKKVKALERVVQQAPAMSGQVPKDADISLRTMASRNKDSEYNHRFAAYVMGPIKGTKFDNGHELPLALDQVKRITTMMGKTADYETLPIDFVMVRAKKGKTDWEVVPNFQPIKCGSSFPVKTIEQIMNKYRNYFIWDSRVKKSNVGYGQH